MLTRVYVETTIPSFYCDTRTAPAVRLRKEWTRVWWRSAKEQHELVTSEAVLEELSGGEPSQGIERLALVQGLPLLDLDPAIDEIVQAYIRHQLMPRDPAGDCCSLSTSVTSLLPGTAGTLPTPTNSAIFVG